KDDQNTQKLNKTQFTTEITDKVGNFKQKEDQNIQSSNLDQVSEVNNVTVTSAVSGNNSILHETDQSSKLSPQKSPLQENNSSIGNSTQLGSKIKPQITQILSNSTKNGGGVGVKSSDLAASLSKNQGNNRVNDTVLGGVGAGAKKQENEVKNLVGCDLLDGGKMLELLRGKRLVFVGDSLNRNMWESLVCILKNSVRDKKKVYEAFGHHNFRTEASYSFLFEDYNSTVEFFVSPFLVQQWEVTDKNGTTKETLRLDLMVSDADQFKSADYIIFNTGHWWTHDKTSKGEDYYQEGSHVYKQLDVTEAFRRAITTWGRWIDANVNPQRTHVLFRGYSASHFSGGQWNSGGQCDSETDPIRNDTYLTEYPPKMKVFESEIKGMKTPVSYLNVTKLTDYRKDGHPSVYRKLHLSDDEKQSPLKYQDCSHWCLPGVPDSWNELLYAELLRKQYKDQQHKNQT
ncbi:hypothetical protein KSS87_012117, partial [Heliosperma pusillum]